MLSLDDSIIILLNLVLGFHLSHNNLVIDSGYVAFFEPMENTNTVVYTEIPYAEPFIEDIRFRLWSHWTRSRLKPVDVTL